MPGEWPTMPGLIEVGERTVNVAFLIMSERKGDDVEVTLLAGPTFRLSGEEASEWSSKLSRLVPGPPEAPTVGKTVVTRRVPKEVRQGK